MSLLLLLLISIIGSSSFMSQSPDLLPILQRALSPTVTSYEILHTIVQGNAMGFVVNVDNNGNNDNKAFVKWVQASNYIHVKKDWNDLRRTLMYIRTECRFYQMIGNLNFAAAPKVHLAEYITEPWVNEDASATGDDSFIKDIEIFRNTDAGGFLVLEYISPDEYLQASPLTIEQAKQCLTAAAQLHASAWQDVPTLKVAEKRLSKASFHLSIRNPKELEGMEHAWEHFAQAFESYWPELPQLNLGIRTKKVTQHVSNILSPTPTSPYATIIHGDYKAMNVFLPRDPNSQNNSQALLVDFASVGLGLGTSDVAMHLHHALIPQDLDQHEEALVKHYWTELAKPDYSWETCWLHYKYSVVDYFRFFLGRFYKTATPSSMEKRASEPNINLVNRNIPAAMRFCKIVDQYLTEIEDIFEQEAKSEL